MARGVWPQRMSDGQRERATVRTRIGGRRRRLTCLLEKRDGSVEDFVVLVGPDPKPRTRAAACIHNAILRMQIHPLIIVPPLLRKGLNLFCITFEHGLTFIAISSIILATTFLVVIDFIFNEVFESQVFQATLNVDLLFISH